MTEIIEQAKPSLVFAVENPTDAKRKLRVAWHLEKEAKDFLWLHSGRHFESPPLFLLVCVLEEESDKMLKEVTRGVTLFKKGMIHIRIFSKGKFLVRPFIVWVKESDYWTDRNFPKRLITRNNFTKQYECGVLDYEGKMLSFHVCGGGPANPGSVWYRMRESVMGPDYFLYNPNISVEINVTR